MMMSSGLQTGASSFSSNAPVEGERRILNSELWHACAGPLVSLPMVGSRVVYFPQGHSEQVAASTQRKLDAHIPNYPNLAPQLICRLHDVILHADVETDEVYCQMTLQPINMCLQQENEPFLVSDIGLQSRQPNIFFCKTLTASDTSTHGGFSIPRRAAEKVFPCLDYTQQPPAQEIIARDLHDVEWKFRHIFRGQPKRHLLTTGWSVFVSSKRLIAGDQVLFIRNEQGKLLLGIRRANRPQTVLPSSVLSSDTMHIGVLAAAALAASTNSVFRVFYNPRASPSEFVIPYSKFEKAVYHTHVSVGMRFRMLFETEESSVRRYMGTITDIGDLDPVRWPNSKWRSIKVGWDESSGGERQRRVSLWEIEPLTTFLLYPPSSNWRVNNPWSQSFNSLLSSGWECESFKNTLLWNQFQGANGVFHDASLQGSLRSVPMQHGPMHPADRMQPPLQEHKVQAQMATTFSQPSTTFQPSPAPLKSRGENKLGLYGQEPPQESPFSRVSTSYEQETPQEPTSLCQQQLLNGVKLQPPLQLPSQQHLHLPQRHTIHQPPNQQAVSVDQSSHEQVFKCSGSLQRTLQQSNSQEIQQQVHTFVQPQFFQQQHIPIQQLKHDNNLHPQACSSSKQTTAFQQQLQQRVAFPPDLQAVEQQNPPVQEEPKQSITVWQEMSMEEPSSCPQSVACLQPPPIHKHNAIIQQQLSSLTQQAAQRAPSQQQLPSALQQQVSSQMQLPLLIQPPVQSIPMQQHMPTQQHVPVQQMPKQNVKYDVSPEQRAPQVDASFQQHKLTSALFLEDGQLSLPRQGHFPVYKQPQIHSTQLEHLHQHQASSLPDLVNVSCHMLTTQPHPTLNGCASTLQSALLDPSCMLNSAAGTAYYSCQSPISALEWVGYTQGTAFSNTFGLQTMLVNNVVDPSGNSVVPGSQQYAGNVPGGEVQGSESLSSHNMVSRQAANTLSSVCLGISGHSVSTPIKEGFVSQDFPSPGASSNSLNVHQGQGDLQSELQKQMMYGTNIDSSSVMSASMSGCSRANNEDLQNQCMSHLVMGQAPEHGPEIPLSSDLMNEELDDLHFLQQVQTFSHVSQPVRTYTKVYKSGSVGRSIDLTRFNDYAELRAELGRMFGLGGLLQDPSSGWQLIFVDKENDWLLLGDDPWEVFVTNVRSIRILSLAEVSQMQDGNVLQTSFPIQHQQASSSSEDVTIQQDSRNPASVITSMCSFNN